MSSQIAEAVSRLVGNEGLKPFEPVAYYDHHMDCIRIELRDCSFTEERIDEIVTLLEDNYPAHGRSPIAGIMLKGVKHLFKELNLPLDGILSVTKIFDELVKKYPQFAALAIYNLVTQIDLNVNMSERRSLAA